MRFLSRPPFVLEYCHALMVEGGKAVAILLGLVQNFER